MKKEIKKEETTCQICGLIFKEKKSFTTHLQTAHKMTSLDYTIKYIYNGQAPTCPLCNNLPRYVSLTFKKYCKVHGKEAMKEGGRDGGKIGGKIKNTWNKGQTKESNIKLQEFSEKYTGEGNPFFGKKHTKESIEAGNIKKRINEEEYILRINARKDVIVLTKYEDYISRQNQYLDVVCNDCGSIIKKTLTNLERGSLCSICHPLKTDSIIEHELKEFIKSLNIENVIYNSKKVIPPYELDVFLFDYNFGIEMNGLYWHGELQKNDKKYHLKKTLAGHNNGIQIFHIFEDEWRDKKEIIKSMIMHRLNLISNKVMARKCTIKELSSSDERDFFNITHIAGYTPSSYCVGLYQGDKLVSVLSFRHPSRKAEGMIEIARFATLPFLHVAGAFSKLLCAAKDFLSNYKTILTYADRRFGEGKVYITNGFIDDGDSGIGYYYTNGRKRFGRLTFRADKANGKSEKQVAELNEVYKIFDCGNKRYLKSI